MNEDNERLQAPPVRAAVHGGRGERLAMALRSNLAKRKEQGRARARASGRSAHDDHAMADDEAAALARPAAMEAAEAPSHDSAEIIAEKSASRAD